MKLQHIQRSIKETVIQGVLNENLPIVEDGLTKEERLSIYQRNTLGSLREFLEASYPKTQALLGEETFQEQAQRFIQAHPPTKASLDDFAFPFEDFLKREGDLSPFLLAVSRFENILRHAMLQSMPPTMDPEKLETLAQEDPENLCFTLHPTTSLYEADYAFHTFWHTLEETPKEHTPQPTKMLIHLLDIESVFKPLSMGEWAFLTALQKKESLGIAMNKALEVEASFDLEKKLSYYVKNQIFQDCYNNISEV